MLPWFPWWVYGIILAITAHCSVVSVSIYLHRYLTHRSIGYMNLWLDHLFRFCLFFTTGILRKQWVAVHRKHHATVDTAEDPHSPYIFGLGKVFWLGWLLYRREAGNTETLEKYGEGTPIDWVESHVYTPHSNAGILTLLALELVLFGLPGLVVWILQMITIPLMGAGVINGIGHAWGYRNYDTPDRSKNIVRVGILAAGEELHNNHHRFQWSAKFSSERWREVDIAWLYIRILRTMRLVGDVKYARSTPFLVECVRLK